MLQKYRLYTTGKSSSTIQSNDSPQQPQFVVVGGIWVPISTPEYAATTAAAPAVEVATAATTNEIYTQVAAPPPTLKPEESIKKQQKEQSKHSDSKEIRSQSEGGNLSSTPAMSSSTHTTTGITAF